MKEIRFEIDCEGNFKREEHIINCLRYVLENFDDIEPTIRKHWLDKEMRKLEIERSKKHEFER